MMMFPDHLRCDQVIDSIKVSVAVVHLGGKLWNPMITWSDKYSVFVQLTGFDGVIGIGECWCLDTSPDTLVTYLRTEICPSLKGKSIGEMLEVFAYLRHRATLTTRHGLLESALSGLDTAIWDMSAKRAEVPMWKAINPDGSGLAKLYVSGGIYGTDKTVEDLAKETSGLAELGFSCVKVKIGGASESEDIERVNAVLKATGTHTKLIIDAVYTYNPEQALRVYRTFDPARIEAFQSPLPQHDIKGMQWLVARGVPVMGVEAEYRREIHTAMIEMKAVKYLQVAPSACGGISRMAQLAEELEGTDIDLSLEVSSSSVATMAGMQFAASNTRVAHVEYHSIHQVFFDRIGLGPHNFNGSNFRLPDTPGLGISLNDKDTEVQFAI